MRVHWTETALNHLSDIYEHIAKDSSIYALEMIDSIVSRSEQLSEYPLSGRTVSEYETQGIREIIEGPYRIIYQVTEQQVDVLALVHGARLLPPEL